MKPLGILTITGVVIVAEVLTSLPNPTVQNHTTVQFPSRHDDYVYPVVQPMVGVIDLKLRCDETTTLLPACQPTKPIVLIQI